jgi:carbonic anhydrase
MTTLILAVYLLGVNRILVMPHTDCGGIKVTDAGIHARAAQHGIDTRSLDFPTITHQNAALHRDLLRIRASPFLSGQVTASGAVYDVTTGRLRALQV